MTKVCFHLDESPPRVSKCQHSHTKKRHKRNQPFRVHFSSPFSSTITFPLELVCNSAPTTALFRPVQLVHPFIVAGVRLPNSFWRVDSLRARFSLADADSINYRSITMIVSPKVEALMTMVLCAVGAAVVTANIMAPISPLRKGFIQVIGHYPIASGLMHR